MGTSGPMWVRWYSAMAVVVMFAIGALTRDARWAILSFVLVLFGLSAYKIVSNIRRGGYGGEE